LVGTTPHSEAVAKPDNPADFGIEADAAPEPGTKMAECDGSVVEVTNLINRRKSRAMRLTTGTRASGSGGRT
jgi:hypothetical protein